MEGRAWIEVAKRVLAGSTAVLDCPVCGHGTLDVEWLPFGDGTGGDFRIRCPKCSAQNFVLKRNVEDLRLDPDLELLASFLSGSIGFRDFETRYLDLFKHDDVIRPEEVFNVLDSLFSDIDAYSPEPVDGEIDEDQLRGSASEAYRLLRTYAQTDRSVD